MMTMTVWCVCGGGDVSDETVKSAEKDIKHVLNVHFVYLSNSACMGL